LHRAFVRYVQFFSVLITTSAAASTYPVGARLVLAPAGQQHCLQTAGGSLRDCGVVEQARKAFGEAAARMFAPRADPELELLLTVQDAQIFEQVSGGLSLDVVVRIAVSWRDGRPLDEIVSNGRVTVGSATSVEDAAAGAAQDAARNFELDYARSERVSSFLVREQVAPESAVAIPRRGDFVFALGVGFGAAQGAGDGDAALLPSVRLSQTFHWFVLQAMYARYTPGFFSQPEQAVPDTTRATLQTNDLGVEVGGVLRFGPSFELRGGPGLHYLVGEAVLDDGLRSLTHSFGKIAPSVFATLSASFLPFPSGFRFQAGIEARAWFGTTVDAPEMGRSVPVASTSLALVFGGEFTWDRRAR
jgi:hypothetical protein